MNNNLLGDKLGRGEKLRLLFLNDLGFQYGAGMAHLRQIQSFLLMGHHVKGLCYLDGAIEGSIPFVPPEATGHWFGMKQLPEVHVDYGYDETEIIQTIRQEVVSIQPDVIIVGNLHGAKWPLELLRSLRDLDALVVAYMHDCCLISGRCAYPGSCQLYKVGCDESCPTADEYPVLAPAEIPRAWRLRRELFCGPRGIPLATNSHWTLGMAQQSLKGLRYANVVFYGLDARLFKPIDRTLARRLLGLPQDRFIILSGAVNVSERRKGTHLFKEVVAAFGKEVNFLVFGAESLGLKNVQATGLLRDYRKMPLLYGAADLFVGTALEEAFGQTLCEAAACAIPGVAFRVGGIPEVARHHVNACLVDSLDVDGLLTEIEFFMKNPQERKAFGQAGRAMVEAEFTLKQQGERWMEYLGNLSTL
jgi:glycosyltransferase involved in cell wall biosynthesis